MNDSTMPKRLEPYRKYLTYGDDLETVLGYTETGLENSSKSERRAVARGELGLLNRLDRSGQLGRPGDYVGKYPSIRNIHPKIKTPGSGDRYDYTEWDSPLIEQTRHLDWQWTEKIDGTNIRIGWDGVDQVSVSGREHKHGNLPGDETGLPALIAETFPVDAFAKTYTGKPMTIYCEGYGPKIGPRGHLYGDAPNLAVLDVVIDGWWLRRDGIEDVAETFGLTAPPMLPSAYSSFEHARDTVRWGFVSLMVPTGARSFYAEGLVGRLDLDLLTRDRKPIRVKIKHQYYHGKQN